MDGSCRLRNNGERKKLGASWRSQSLLDLPLRRGTRNEAQTVLPMKCYAALIICALLAATATRGFAHVTFDPITNARLHPQGMKMVITMTGSLAAILLNDPQI